MWARRLCRRLVRPGTIQPDKDVHSGFGSDREFPSVIRRHKIGRTCAIEHYRSTPYPYFVQIKATIAGRISEADLGESRSLV